MVGNRTGLIRPHNPQLSLIQRCADALWVVLVHLAVARFYAGEWTQEQTIATCVGVLSFQLVAEAAGLYQAWRGVPFRKELLRVCVAWMLAVPIVLLLLFMMKSSESLSRVVTLAWFACTPFAIVAWRAVVRGVLSTLRRSGRNTRTVGIVGQTEMGEHLARRAASSPELGLSIVGFFDDRTVERLHDVEDSIASLVGGFDDLVERCKRGEIDLVYIALPLKAEPRVNALLRKLADTTASVYYVPDFFVFDLLHSRWSQLGDIPVVSIFETPFYGVDGILKRVEDVILGTLFLTIAAPAMALVALAIKLTSKGPVFFRQRRYGLNGEVIEVLKFRTMAVMENGAKVTQATKSDTRITPLGRLLRRTSIDELPQLIHVVTGSMSLVGPRPHAVAHNEEYRKRIHGYMLRHKVKPGLTGWAQVNGWRGETDTLEKMEKRIEHDLEYIRRWGIFFDLRIVLMTIFGRAAHKNAY